MLKRIKIFWKLGAAFILITLLVMLILGYGGSLIGQNLFSINAEAVGSGKSLLYLAVILIVLILSFGAALLFVRLFIYPHVLRLDAGMNKLADKEFDFRLDEDEKDEFGSLASSFNDMASMLDSSLNELKKNKDYIESILESSADIIITVNASDRIQTINTGAETTLGYGRLELIGKHIEMLFADPTDRQEMIERLKLSDNVVNVETQFVTKAGEVRDVLLTCSRLRNRDGAIIGTIGISKDITEEKRLQNQLIQSQRYAAIGQVFTGIQHSMKNMLNACKGGSYMVRTGLAKDNRKMLEEGWEIVQEGISRLTDMSVDMLKYVKEWKPRFDRVDLTKILSEIHRVIKQTAKDKGVKVRLNIRDDLPEIICDPRMIHSSTMDIVSNALDACLWKDYSDDEKPEISLGAYMSEDGRKAVIEVRDNGCGMTEDVKANIFDPFFSTKSKAGTGLGLSITSRMIGVHGGKFDVESVPDQGTIFRILLPIDANNKNKEKTDAKEGSGS
jgi:PAS domain S-box-containing protein